MTSPRKPNKVARIAENLCSGRNTDADGFCPDCHRYGKVARDHRPNASGAFGYVVHYANGTTRNIDRNEAIRAYNVR